MKSGCRFAIIALLAAVLLSPLIERIGVPAEILSKGEPVVSSLVLPVPYAADRLRTFEKFSQERSSQLQFRMQPPELLGCAGYGGPLVTSRERAVLDLLAPTLRSGKACLQV